MILVLALAAALADVDPPAKAPPSLMDLFSDGSAEGTPREPERFHRCRLYNCGLPTLRQLEERLDRNGEADER